MESPLYPLMDGQIELKTSCAQPRHKTGKRLRTWSFGTSFPVAPQRLGNGAFDVCCTFAQQNEAQNEAVCFGRRYRRIAPAREAGPAGLCAWRCSALPPRSHRTCLCSKISSPIRLNAKAAGHGCLKKRKKDRRRLPQSSFRLIKIPKIYS